MRELPSRDLDDEYRRAVRAEREARERRLFIQDERFRRFRLLEILNQQPDWPDGELPTQYPMGELWNQQQE